MNTLAKTHSQLSDNSNSITLSERYDQFIKKLEFSHFALIAMAILIGSCMGSITAMYVFMNNAPLWMFVVGLSFALANLVACISQAPTKWVVNFFAASLLVNIVLLIMSLL